MINQLAHEVSKPYQLTFIYRSQYLHAIVEGIEDSVEISDAYWTEIARECKRGKLKKVLVEERIEGNVSLAEAFDVGEKNSKKDFGHAVVAFVDIYEDHDGINEFASRVSNNRGRLIRCHESIAQAEKWLLSQDN
jgi:hypothetical protein